MISFEPQNYDQQLEDKVLKLKMLLEPFMPPSKSLGITPAIYPSPHQNFRMRAEFRVWHEANELDYVMFHPGTRQQYKISAFPIGSQLINDLMSPVLQYIKENKELRNRLFQIDYLTTQTGQALITLLYHRQLDSAWQEEAEQFKAYLQDYSLSHLQSSEDIHLIGRARKQKILIHSDRVIETLNIQGKNYFFEQVENSFTQPNASVNEKMIEWALQVTKNSEGDLLELYCGSGNFSLPLAQNFQAVLGTEISRSSVESAQRNIALNQIKNVQIARFSAEEFSAAMVGQFKSRRVDALALEDYQFQTVLVDPPRAGLDQETLKLIAKFPNIVYISCNPITLAENLKQLSQSHQIEAYALFDQFPYTQHIESGVLLKAKKPS